MADFFVRGQGYVDTSGKGNPIDSTDYNIDPTTGLPWGVSPVQPTQTPINSNGMLGGIGTALYNQPSGGTGQASAPSAPQPMQTPLNSDGTLYNGGGGGVGMTDPNINIMPALGQSYPTSGYGMTDPNINIMPSNGGTQSPQFGTLAASLIGNGALNSPTPAPTTYSGGTANTPTSGSFPAPPTGPGVAGTSYQATPYDPYSIYGLSTAAQLVNNNIQAGSNYPQYVPSAAQSPTQQQYYDYKNTTPLAQIQAPSYQANGGAYQNANLGMQNVASQNAQAAGYNWQDTNLNGSNVNQNYQKLGGSTPSYQGVGTDAQTAGYNYQKLQGKDPAYQGLMGGDYNALQTALQTPGDIAAKTAYDQGQTNLTNQMGGKGLYGSSIMADQARTNLDTPYQNALATNAANAASTRYGMQATDLQNQNQFNTNVYGQQMGENQNMNAAGLDYAKLQTGVNQQNVANALNQSQNANQFGLNVYGQQMAENQNANQFGQTQALANQSNNMQLQGLLSTQGLAKNASGLTQAQMQTNVNQQNAANNLAGQQSNQSTNMQLQGLIAAQSADQNKYNLSREQQQNQYNLTNTGLLQNQAASTQQAQANEANRQMAYGEGQMNYNQSYADQLRNWQNQQNYEKYSYELSKMQAGQANQQNQLNQALALAGQGSPLINSAQQASTAANNLTAQQAIAAQNNATASNAGWLKLAGTAGAGLLSNETVTGAVGSGLSSAYDWASGLL